MGNFITIIIWIAIVYAIMKKAKKSSKPKAETPYENTSAKKQETVISQRLKEKYAPKPKKKLKKRQQKSAKKSKRALTFLQGLQVFANRFQR